MKKLFFKIILVLIVLAACKKEHSLEVSLSDSAGSLQLNAATGNCLSSVYGTYKTDSILNTNNYIIDSVNVTTPGAYTIQTDTINGFWFNASGTFYARGIYAVKLLGNGKPILPLTSNFTIKYSGTTCSVSVTTISSSSPAVFNINCTGIAANGAMYAGTPVTSANTLTVPVTVTAAGSYTLNTTLANGISYGASGIFTGTGTQNVILVATGTPTAAGSFNYTILGAANSCVQAVTCNAALPPVAYTFNCTSFVVNGTYTAGTVLTSANTITGTVNVTSIGAYSISTTSANGVSFSASGVFINTGTQNITLKGAGTPTASGSFNYTISGGTNTCSQSVSFNAAPLPVSYTFNCTSFIANGTYTAGTALTSSNTITGSVNVATVGAYSISIAAANGISFSATGTFANTGVQNITLTGTGTPANAGTNNYSISGNGNTCSISITVGSAAVATDFITCKINGSSMSFNNNALSTKSSGSGSSSLSVSGNSNANESIVLGITNIVSETLGTGSYTSSGATLSVVGMYTDQSNITWVGGIVAYSSNFTIVVTSIDATRVSGTFTGVIKDNVGAGPNSKTITEGSFSVPIH